MLINCTESPFQEWTREMLDKVESTYGLIIKSYFTWDKRKYD